MKKTSSEVILQTVGIKEEKNDFRNGKIDSSPMGRK